MKNTWKNIVVILAVLGALTVASARAAVSVYAEDVPSGAVAPATVTNAPATDSGLAGAGHPPVRIDETGIHVGGPNPVDINVPGLAHYHAWRGVDVTGIIAIISTFGMPVALILIIFYFKHRRNKMAHETLRAMIDKGMPITPELIAEVRNKGCGSSTNSASGRTRSRLLPGLVLAGVGTALLISGSKGEARGGWIVLFIGAAFLIVWFVEQKNQNDGQPPR